MKKINGRELIKYPIDIALKSKKITKVLVTSNDEKSLNKLKKVIFFNKKFFFINEKKIIII